MGFDAEVEQLGHGREVRTGGGKFKIDDAEFRYGSDDTRGVDIQPGRVQPESLEFDPSVRSKGARVKFIGRVGQMGQAGERTDAADAGPARSHGCIQPLQ